MPGKSFFANVCLFLLVTASGCALHRGIFGSSATAPHTVTLEADKAEIRLRNEIVGFAKNM